MNNDFSKQAMAEERLRQIREQTHSEYVGDYNSKHIKNVPDNTIKADRPEVREVFRSEYKTDFDKASKDFWQRETQKGLQRYNGGSLTANFGKDVFTYEEFLERVGKFIKESITNELIDRGETADKLHENFAAVDLSLKLLAKSVDTGDPKTGINIENITAFLHGFINTYVSKTVHKKIERDKGNAAYDKK